MSSLDRKILLLVTKISKRIQVSLTMGYILLFGSLALAAGILLVAASMFIPIYDVYSKVFIILTVSAAFSIILGIIKRPGIKDAAKRLDSLGLQERAQTAVELIGKEFPMALLQKEDALFHIKKAEYKKHIPIVTHRKILVLFIIFAGALMMTGFISNPMSGRAEMLHQLDEDKSGISDKLDKMMRDVEKDSNLSQEQKNEIKSRLTEVKEDVDLSSSREELDKALEKSAEKMELTKQKLEQRKKDIIDALSKQDSTKDIADAIARNDKSGLKEAVNNLNEKLKGMDEQQKKDVQDTLSKAVQDKNADAVFKKVMQLAADEISQSSVLSESTTEAMTAALSSMMDENEYINKADELSKELGNMAGSKPGTSNEGMKSNKGEGGTKGNQGMANNSQSSPSKAQDNTNDGSSGQGSDTTGMPGAGITKKDSSERKLGEYEKVFTPSLAGGDGQSSQLKGKLNKSGSTEITEGDKAVDRGESISYDKVYGQYKDQALESISSSTIPEGMKEIVRDYFSSLDE